jgi:hypothetical protein
MARHSSEIETEIELKIRFAKQKNASSSTRGPEKEYQTAPRTISHSRTTLSRSAVRSLDAATADFHEKHFLPKGVLPGGLHLNLVL